MFTSTLATCGMTEKQDGSVLTVCWWPQRPPILPLVLCSTSFAIPLDGYIEQHSHDTRLIGLLECKYLRLLLLLLLQRALTSVSLKSSGQVYPAISICKEPRRHLSQWEFHNCERGLRDVARRNCIGESCLTDLHFDTPF